MAQILSHATRLEISDGQEKGLVEYAPISLWLIHPNLNSSRHWQFLILSLKSNQLKQDIYELGLKSS